MVIFNSMLPKKLFLLFIVIAFSQLSNAQETYPLSYFLRNAEINSAELQKTNNLQKIGQLQIEIIKAQQNAFNIDATGEVLVAPYFNNNGNAIDVTTNPSRDAFGYDVGITNGGLYSAQLNITKNLFNSAATQNLLFQNKILSDSLQLYSEKITHNIIKNITDTYITAYQLQLKQTINKEIAADLENRLKVVEVLVKHAILQQSDYLLLQVDINQKELELLQLESDLQKNLNQLFTLCALPLKENVVLEVPNLTSSLNETANYFNKKFKVDSLQIEAEQLVYENRYKPQISAYANTGLNAVEFDNISHKIGASAGLKVTVPIYDGGQRKLFQQQSKLKQENLNFFRKNKEIEIENNLKSLQQQMDLLQRNLELIDAQLQKQENIMEIYKEKLVNGQVSIVDYLNVAQNYKMNIYTKLQMQTNYWLFQNQYNYTNW